MAEDEIESIGATNVNDGQHNVDVYIKSNTHMKSDVTKVECNYFINLPPLQNSPHLNARLFLTDGTITDVPYQNVMRFEYISLDGANKQMMRHFEKFNERLNEMNVKETDDGEDEDDSESVITGGDNKDHSHCQMFG